ncbi:hypothetical protein [Aestuariicoccus sp. MJ-SS9]|uniref:hypothetical protein n=1 Tax=Aestuariicoccus sp. MJ-SS9 TaxID=3079855 RepID=UPI002912F6E3|nr:hypothetical protein [Aestuariicoccus sp. MJ-SS9]MDU8912785.1 hypothetical protein [Aestuariicoccus sp. MJ-SS9]
MSIVTKTVEILKPFKDLITIVVFLAGAGYGAISYFATAQQLAETQEALQKQLALQHAQAEASLTELKCLNALNRDYLRAQIEEVGLRALLEKNLQKSGLLRDDTSDFARVELASLELSRTSLTAQLSRVNQRRDALLLALQNGDCSNSA